MGKSSRWSQWVIAESKDPNIAMPWVTRAQSKADDAEPSVSARVLAAAFAPALHPQH
jgi:hypothetical protein